MKRSIIIIIVMLCLFGCCLFYLYSLGYLSFDRNNNTEDKTDVSFEVNFKNDTYDMKYCDGSSANHNERNKVYISDRKHQDVGDKISKDLNDRSDKFWSESITNYGDECVEAGASLGPGITYFYEIASKNDNYISFVLTMDGSLGGVSWVADEGYTYDLNTGNLLHFDDISNNSQELRKMLFTNYTNFVQKKDENGKSISDDLWVGMDEGDWNDILERHMFDDGNWYILNNGDIRNCMPKYSIGAGYLGVICINTPYSEIDQYIKEEYKK